MNDMMNKLKGIIATGSTGDELNTAPAAAVASSSSSPPVGTASGASPSGSISTLNKFAPTNSGNSTPSSANAPTLIASSLNAFKINVLPRTTSASNSAVKSEVTSKPPAKRTISNSGLGNKNFAPTGSKADRILGRCNSDSNQQKNRQNRAAAANKIVATVNSSSTPASPLLNNVGSSSITSGFCSPKQAAALIDNQSPHSPIKTQSPIRVKMPALNLEEYRIKLAAHRERDSQRCVGIGCRIKLNKNKDNNSDNCTNSSTNQVKLGNGDLLTNDGDTTESQLNNVDNSNTDDDGNINSAQDKCPENINSSETEAKLETENGKQESTEDTSDVNLNDKTTRSPSLKSVDSVEIVTNNTNDAYNDADDDIDRIIESSNNVEPLSNLEPTPSTSLSVSFGTCDYKKSPTCDKRSPTTNRSANEPAKSIATDSLTLSIVADSGQTSTETQLTILSPPNTALEISIQSPTTLGPTSIVFTPNPIKSPQPTSENHQPNNANNSNSQCNTEKPDWSKPASLRPFCFVRSLSSGVASVSPGGSIAFDTPSPRSPITQANYLCPKASTKLSTKTVGDQIDPVKSLDSSSQSNSIPPLLTISDILLEIRVKSIERILISLMGKILFPG